MSNQLFKKINGQPWLRIPVIPAQWRLRWDHLDSEFQARLGNTAKPHLKTNNNKGKTVTSKDVHLDDKTIKRCKWAGIVVHTCNPCTLEAEAGGS
jgi:hypothetical protein